MRALVALLLLANLGFLALAQGWLQPYVGLASAHEREPQRLALQVDAASVRIVSGAVPSPADCLLAGPFSATQLEAAEFALAQQSAGSWQRVPDAAGGERASLRIERPTAAARRLLQDLAGAAPQARVTACSAAR